MKIRESVVAACLLAISQTVTAQPAPGSVIGTVLHPDDSVIADAPVRARNDATGTDARTRSTSTGRYEFQDLPAGTYVLSLHMPCCDFRPYVNDNVVVNVGEAHEFDIHVEGGMSIEGDDPGTVNAQLLSRQIIPDLPVPRTANGRPDLSGLWLTSRDPYPEEPKALEWAEQLAQQRRENSLIDHPRTRCLPSEPAFPGGSAFNLKFVQTPDLVVQLFEDIPGFRQIFLDGRDHPENPNPSWMGHSIGRWEGDTLVVDTIGFNDRGWSGVYPRTEKLRMEERYRRSDFGHLEARVTFDDPGVFEEPLIRNMTWDLAPQEELMEYVCENNQWAREVEE